MLETGLTLAAPDSDQTRRYLLAMPQFSMNAVMSYIKMKSRPRPYHRKFDLFVQLLLDEVMVKRRFARLNSLAGSWKIPIAS